MKRKNSFYKNLEKEVKHFLDITDDKEFFILKTLCKTREFKAYLKDKECDKLIPSLFSEKELKIQRIY